MKKIEEMIRREVENMGRKMKQKKGRTGRKQRR